MILAADPATIDPSIVTPGLLGFLAFVVLAVATWLLVRSFNKQLRKIQVPKTPKDASREDLHKPLSPPYE